MSTGDAERMKADGDIEGLVNSLQDTDRGLRNEAAEALDELHWRPSNDSEKALHLFAKEEYYVYISTNDV